MYSRYPILWFLGACLLALMTTTIGSAVTLEQIVSREHPYFSVSGANMGVGRDGKVYLCSPSGGSGYVIRINRDGTNKSGGVLATESCTAVAANSNGIIAVTHAHFAACAKLYDTSFSNYATVKAFTTVNYDEPSDVQVGASGDFYAIDPANNRVVRFNQQGKIVNTYSYPAPVQGRYMSFRVCEAASLLYFFQGYVNGGPAPNPVVAVGFDGLQKWTLTYAQTDVRTYDRLYGGCDVDDTGTLYTLCEHSTVINKWNSSGASVGSITLSGTPANGGNLRVFGTDAVVNYNFITSNTTELFRVYNLSTGAFVRSVLSDYDQLDATYSSSTWTAGSVIPFTITFTPGGGRSTNPNWNVWLRNYGQSQYTQCTWASNQLTVPSGISGLFQVKVTPEVSPTNGYSDYMVQDMVEIRPSGALGSVSVLTSNNRVGYAPGDAVNFSVIFHTSNSANLPSSVTVNLKDDQGTTVANGTAPISQSQTQQNFYIPSAITAGLRPGKYTLTVSSANFSTDEQPLFFGQGDKGSTFRNLIYGDYGMISTVSSNPFDVRDTITKTTNRLNKLGTDFIWDPIGTSFLEGNINWDGTSNNTMSTLASRLSGDQNAADSGKVMDESPYLQSLANYSAFGIRNYARLMNMDTGMPLGTGIVDRNETQYEADIATVTNACLPYSAFKGWGWAGNWWPGNSIVSMGNAQEQSDYNTAFSTANSNGTWATILDTLSNRWLAQPATQWGLFNTKLNTITGTLQTTGSGPVRNPMGYPPTNYAPVNGVDLQCQFEQIPLEYIETYSTDLYKRAGKPAYAHPELYNDSGTGEEILPTCLSFFMRGANSIGCAGNYPSFGEYFDSRTNNGVTSIFRAMNTAIGRPYGPWYTALQAHDPVALVSSSRPFQLDNDRGWTGMGCKHFQRMFEAYVSLMHAHYPATIVLGNDVTPTCLNGYKAIVLVDQVYQLEPALVTALSNAQTAGVPIFYDGTCLASLMTGYTALGVSFNKCDSIGNGNDYTSIIGVLTAAQQNEAGIATAFAAIPQPETAGYDEVFLTERTAESARYVSVLNHCTPTEISSAHLWRMALWCSSRVPVQTTVGLGDLTGKTVYDVFARQQVTPSGQNVTADLRTLPMRLYAILPAAINNVELTGPNTSVTAGQPFSWKVRVRDSGNNPILASIPIRVRLLANDGVTVLQELFTAAGSAGATGTISVPLNTVGGSPKLEAAELFSGKSATQTITVTAAGTGTLPLQGQGAPSQNSPLPASLVTSGTTAMAGLSTATSQFGPHLRDIIITNNGNLAVMNASNWGTNLYAINLSDGSVSYRKRVGQFFTYAPQAISSGTAVQGFNFPDGNGYGLYLVDNSGNLTKRFNLYGLPKRLPHRFVPQILSETMNNFATPSDASWVATSGSLGLAVWNNAGTLLWHDETLCSCKLAALGTSTLLVTSGMTATAYNATTGAKQWSIVLANNGAITQIAVTSDGASCALASTANGNTIYVLKYGTKVATIVTACNDLGITADGTSVAVVTGNLVKLYNIPSGMKWSFAGEDTLCFPRFSADGSKVAVSSVLGTVDVLSASTGAKLFEHDYASLTVSAWHAGGDLILATWNGWVYRVNGSSYAQTWAAQVTPVETDMHGHLLDADGASVVQMTGWGNIDTTQPLTPNLAYDSTGVEQVTFLAYDSNLNPANGFSGFISSTAPLFDGSTTPPANPWLNWSDVSALSQVGEMWPYQYIQIDTWRRQLNITGITFVEDPAHPESWVREAYLQYWDPVAQAWKSGESMMGDAATHSHMFVTPVQASRIRIQVPTTAPGNLRLAELVLHGTNLGANHPDVIAQHDTAVLFDENLDEFTTTCTVHSLHGSNFQTGGAYSGGICIYQTVAGGVRGNVSDANWDQSHDGSQPGWDFVISSNPTPGQYRYLTFAVKGTSAATTGIKVGLRLSDGNAVGYYAGSVDPNPTYTGNYRTPLAEVQVATTAPTNWTSYTVDLRQYFAEGSHVQGIFMTCAGGDALFDRILLSRTTSPNEFPTITLTDPGEGTFYTSPANVVINANAADGDGTITKVEFYQGSTLINTDSTSPYSYTWATTTGSYTLTAKAYDNGGLVTTSAPMHILINNPPAVTLTAPTEGTSFPAPASIAFTATATDADGSITKVEFYQDGTWRGQATSSPYTFTWTNVPAGSYALTAKAYDNLGSITESSAVHVTVFVNNPPTVSITSPNNGAIFTAPATVTINATASDSDGTISKVEFYQGSTLLGTDSTSPYSYTWTNVLQGSYTLTAKAYDNYNLPTTSTGVGITVNPSLPTTGMLLWLRADSLSLNNGDPVNTWTDISGNGRNAVFTQVGGVGVAPVYTTNVFNGKPVVRFNGNSLLQVSSLPLGTYTIVAIFKTSNSQEIVYEHGDDMNFNPTGNFLWTSTTSTVSVKRSGVQTGKDIVCANPTTWAANITAPIMTMDQFDGTDAGEKLYINTANQTLNENYVGNLNTTTPTDLHFNIGLRAAYGGLQFHGDLAEIVVYDHALSAADMSTINSALMSKYALDNPPTVTLTAPTGGTVFTAPANITLTATASDSDGTISKVEFYNGYTLIGSDTTSPYNYTWNSVAAGNYTLSAIAYDNNNLPAVSSTAAIIVDTPPTVSLTAPANNTNYIAPASVALSATASDSDGTISKVEFYQGSTLVGTASTSPYNYTWTSVAMGNYALTAKAYDNNNVTTTSSAVNIIVWGTSDIGSVGVAGSASYASGTFTVSGAGAGVTSTADAFRYVYRQFSGNTTIIARIATAASATSAERAGVMMRQNLNANSIEASAMYKPTSTYYVYFLRRTSAGGSTSSTSSTAAAVPYWVKVVRSSNTLSAFMSANGSSWTQVGSNTTVTMTDPIYVGLAVTSGSTSAAKTVTFDNVSITQP